MLNVGSGSLLSSVMLALMGLVAVPDVRGPRLKRWEKEYHLHAPHGGGKREVARRQRQLAAGTLKVN